MTAAKPEVHEESAAAGTKEEDLGTGTKAEGGEAPTAAAATTRLKLLLSGDAEGNLIKLYTQAANQQKKIGKFDLLFAVGGFLPGAGTSDSSAALAEYVTGKRQCPVQTYFIESRSAALLQSAPEGKTLCANVNFLGGFGIREIAGLRVAFLSGHYDAEVYNAQSTSVATPAFVGASYTPMAVESLIRLSQEPGAPAIDVLLTAEWPTNIDTKLDETEGPKHPEGSALDLQPFSSPAVAELCAVLEPRYHIFGAGDLFYQRPPFQTLARGHVCRCIAIGKVGSKGKGRTWVHGLSLSPSTSMPSTALMQRPENTTPCPFASMVKSEPALNGTDPSRKRGADALDQDGDGRVVVPNEVFLGGLPPIIDERRLMAAFKEFGTIERISLAREDSVDGRPCRGFGWVTFATPQEADAACDLSELLECGGRKISISISRRKPRADGTVGGRKRREVQIVIEPHSECWFCLVNPEVEKHMIVTATTQVYVATARGPIIPSHVLILPVKHAPCFAACPPELQEALAKHIEAIRRMFKEAKQECLVFERWIPMSASAANHMQIQILPMDQNQAYGSQEALQEMGKKYLPDANFKKVEAYADVVDHLNDDSATPYVYFELPGDNTAAGRKVERFIHVGQKDDDSRIPINFGRQVACQIFDCEEKVDWRQCTEDRDREKQLAVAFRQEFKDYAPDRK